VRACPGTQLGVRAINGSILLEIPMTVLPRNPALPHTRPPFDALTIALHWSTLLLILGLLGTALLHSETRDHSLAQFLLHIHRSIGVTIWALTALRLGWRLTRARMPAFPMSMTTSHRLMVRLSEYGLYGLLLFQPGTGLGQTLLQGRPFEVFGWNVPATFAKDLRLSGAFQEAHELGGWCLIVLASMHALAALIHHFILRDDVLETMAPALRRRLVPSRSLLRSQGSRSLVD
jgi:superoxide oxidase